MWRRNSFELIKLMAEDGNIDKIMKDEITSKNYYHHKISIQTEGMFKKEDVIDYSKMPEVVPAISNISDEPIINRLTFDDVDHAVDVEGRVEKIEAPKSIERLEEISVSRNLQRKLEEEADSDDDERLIISDDVNIDLGAMSFDPTPPIEEEIQLDFDTLGSD